MARDRQRAKQRRARRAAQQGSPQPETNRLHRENVPGGLDHASGQVEQFEAALIAGSGGEPVEDDLDSDADGEVDADFDLEDEDEADEVATTGAGAATVSAGAVPAVARPGRPAETRRGNRAIAFLRASWAELQRVQWPDRRQVAQATAVVIGFLMIAGAYLGLADTAAQRIVKFIL